MEDRIETRLRKKELKMWFIVMLPFVSIGLVVLFTAAPNHRHIPFLILLIGYAIYYSWRFRFRKKQKELSGSL